MDVSSGPLLPALFGYHDRDVAGALENAGSPSTGTGAPTLQRGALVCIGFSNHEFFSVECVIVLGVGYRRVQNLAHRIRGSPVSERENVARFFDRKSPDEVEHPPHFVR